MTTQTCKCDPESIAVWSYGHDTPCPEFPIYCATCYMGSAVDKDADCPCCNNRGSHRQADNVECKA